jgi:hypothetical protein
MGLGGQRHVPNALLPSQTRYPLYGSLGGSQSRCGRVRKISPPPGSDPWTVQPVESSDWVIPAHVIFIYLFIYLLVYSINARILGHV